MGIQCKCATIQIVKHIKENIIQGQANPTKRQVLRVLFDPLGLLEYFILKGKLILKSIWRRNTDWDQSFHEEKCRW